VFVKCWLLFVVGVGVRVVYMRSTQQRRQRNVEVKGMEGIDEANYALRVRKFDNNTLGIGYGN